MEYTIKGLEQSINHQAIATLCYLRGETNIDRENEGGYLSIDTHAWYNGREDGICLTVCVGLTEWLVITFGEHRVSDGIYIDWWLMKTQINPPTINDFTEQAYAGNREIFNYGEALKAADYIRFLIELYVRGKDTE